LRRKGSILKGHQKKTVVGLERKIYVPRRRRQRAQASHERDCDPGMGVTQKKGKGGAQRD